MYQCPVASYTDTGTYMGTGMGTVWCFTKICALAIARVIGLGKQLHNSTTLKWYSIQYYNSRLYCESFWLAICASQNLLWFLVSTIIFSEDYFCCLGLKSPPNWGFLLCSLILLDYAILKIVSPFFNRLSLLCMSLVVKELFPLKTIKCMISYYNSFIISKSRFSPLPTLVINHISLTSYFYIKHNIRNINLLIFNRKQNAFCSIMQLVMDTITLILIVGLILDG